MSVYDYHNNVNEKRTKKFQNMDIQVGGFVHLLGEFHDVWHQVREVFDSALIIASDGKTEYKFFHSLARYRDNLPANTRIVYFGEGSKHYGKKSFQSSNK